jgi:hypothetical protein
MLHVWRQQSSRLCAAVEPTTLLLSTTTPTKSSGWRGKQRESRQHSGQPHIPMGVRVAAAHVGADGAPGEGARGSSLDGRRHAGGAPGGGDRVDGDRGLYRRRDSPSPDRYHGRRMAQAIVRDIGPGGGRRNQTVVGKARALLKQRGMSGVFWGEVVVTAVYILNRSPTKALNGMTPYEAWHGRKPTVSHLRVFGCLAFIKELGHIGKLDDRSTPGVFIGYAEGSKAYHILDLLTLRVRTTRDVVFNEWRGWAWDKAVDDDTTPKYDDFTIEYVHFEGAGGVGDPSSSRPTPAPKSPPTPTPRSPALATTSSSPPRNPATTPAPASSPSPRTPAPTIPSPGTSSPTPARVEHDPVELVTPLFHESPASSLSPRTPAPTIPSPRTSSLTPARVKHDPVECVTSLSHDEERVDACYDDEPLRYRKVEGLLIDPSVPGLASRILAGELHLACDDGEPRSFAEAEKHAAWRVAMQSEMDAVETNRTWELADLPYGHRAITLKWMFKLKRDEAGAIVKHKARLVARGFLQ